MRLSQLQKKVGPGWGTLTIDHHPHQWRKIIGENKVFCRVIGCSKTRFLYPAGQLLKTGAVMEKNEQGIIFTQCSQCGVYVNPDEDHICDGPEGRAIRDQATRNAFASFNKIFGKRSK